MFPDLCRGEQFRHLQNLRGSRSHLWATNIHTVPSLPFRLLSLADPSASFTGYDRLSQPKIITTPDAGESQPDGTSSRPQAGPAPPKSWRLTTRKDIRETASWRSEALSPIFNRVQQRDQTSDILSPSSVALDPQGRSMNGPICITPRVPSLTLLCLQIVIATCTTSEFRDEVLPYIPSHLKKDLIRFTAIHAPLTGPKLYSLWEPFGHADGEMIVVGPNAILKDDHFIRLHSRLHPEDADASAQGDGDRDWDAEEDVDANVSLTTLILLNTSLSSSTLFSLPPTITHLAFISLSSPVPLHRLPNVCPLLVMLDLSYNSWLGTNSNSGNEGQGLIGQLGEPQQLRNPGIRATVDLGRVDWHRWNHLKVLGFRGNYVPDGFMNKVNEGRWDDVEVVL